MSLTLPPGFQSVGIRFGKSQATNRGQDQSFVFAMLKAIPEAQGGARQQLAGESVPMLGDGTCSRFLGDLIVRFQRSSSSLTSKDGVVDPAGATLRLMMKLSGAAGAPTSTAKPAGKAVPSTKSALPAQRLTLLQACSAQRDRKPTAQELLGFFASARTEAVPTLDQAQKSLALLSNGCYIQGTTKDHVRHWCGIFACAVARSAGLGSLRWTLHGGKIVGAPLIMGNQDMLPGDIAIIRAYNHHFLLTGFPACGKVSTLEGNTDRQKIKAGEQNVSSIVGFYRTVPL